MIEGVRLIFGGLAMMSLGIIFNPEFQSAARRKYLIGAQVVLVLSSISFILCM